MLNFTVNAKFHSNFVRSKRDASPVTRMVSDYLISKFFTH